MTHDSNETHEVWTPLRVLQWAVPYLKEKGVDSPRLDVECLLAKALQCDRLKVYLQYDRPLSRDELTLLHGWVARRAKREPLAYLLGEREFYGLPFEVNPSVLIPRPDSELLVEKAVAALEALPPEERMVLDLGTGSGCLAVAITHTVPGCRAWAVDISSQALEMAKRNAETNGVGERIQFRQGSWWAAIQEMDPQRYPVIVSNPPYISENEKADLDPEILMFEPKIALFAENEGLSDYEAIKIGLAEHLTKDGKAFIEMNSNIHSNIEALWKDWPHDIYQDINCLPRVLALFINSFT
jgi:release factor glutamine methyltransferase